MNRVEKIPARYKQTEIGVIPEDWEVVSMGTLGSFSKGQGIRKDQALSGKIPCIRYGEIYTHHNNIVKQFNSWIAPNIAKTSKKLKQGDILFAGSGETKEEIGKCVAFLSTQDAYAGGDIVILSPIKGDSRFFGYLFNSPIIVSQKSSKGQGDAVVHISATALSTIKIPTPEKYEQTAIATVLSDTDALIEHLGKLIAKKKAIKQGAMQQLLTGKKRLPGFSGEWEAKLFGSLIEINKGQQLNKSELTTTGEYPDWNGGIEPSGYTTKWNMVENTITISEGGNSCGFVNYCKQKFWCGGHCYTLKIKSVNLSKLFLFQLLKFKEKSIMNLRIGSGLPNIQKKNLNEFELFIPKESEEQTAIATVLSDMDAEIKKLEQKLDKYQQIKTGMTQQLLTGKIRLGKN